MTLSREPLAVREGADIALVREGVPASVVNALRAWIFETVKSDEDEAEHALIRLDLVVSDAYWQRYRQDVAQYKVRQAELDAQYEARQAAVEARQSATEKLSLTPVYAQSREFAPAPTSPYVRFLAYGTPAEMLWYVADDLLHALCAEPLPPDVPITTFARKFAARRRTKKITASLRRLLEESRSVYEIAPDDRGLRRRIDVSLAQQADQAEEFAMAAGRPAARQHLARARGKLLALDPEPDVAYGEAIRAVEAVANPFLLPRNPSPTLSLARDHLRDAAAKYEFVITAKSGVPGSVAVVVEMLSTLCSGQSDRHAGGPNNAPVTQESAESAFALAVTLVIWFSTGAVRRRPDALPRGRSAPPALGQ
ncbi:hypothetical protein KGA66_24920 [Actinocrinis puniceicyclus]|uniref:Uncharacterized protein n=1 Tax=Actinocrinis puniceicyclus TaxID=977794 RepID=A0A8J7WTR1_9ACTN|nr:hypothetical protein [Actinocrinis puniceicyclus]MBS2966312.1 hypothetical protein [Actinocrinis puniceicyclus]